jgi:hypothetical protein
MGHDLERVTEHLRVETMRQYLGHRKSLGAQVDSQLGLTPTPPRRVGPVVQAQDALPAGRLSMQGEKKSPHLPPMTEQAQIDDVGIRHDGPKEGTEPCRKPNDVKIPHAPVRRGRGWGVLTTACSTQSQGCSVQATPRARKHCVAGVSLM